MKLIYIDFETYYDKAYSLKNMTAYEYILDPRYETIGCGVAVGNEEPFFLPGDKIEKFLREYPEPYACVSYNALFDASILSFRYGLHPKLLIDAMGLVRATLVHRIRNGRVNLENVSKVLGLPPKGDTVHKVVGMGREALEQNPELWAEFKEYCLTDVRNCRSITRRLATHFPKQEIWVMDAILRACTRPNFYGNLDHLCEHLATIVAEKQSLLARVGLERKDLLSSAKFADALKKLGVDPPTKLSPSDPTKTMWAFAKTDEEFRALEEHNDPDVQALAAARLGVRSTLEERRTERFIGMTKSALNAFDAPWMPVALRYGAAHTHRFGGDWKINQQNLPARKSKKLREALIAPPEHKVVAVDASQIEARLVAWLAGEKDLLQEFAAGHDVYVWFGSELFNKPITKADKLERFIAKNTVLGLGFQMGAKRFLSQLTNQAADMGLELPSFVTFSQCEVWVQFYRNRFRNIVKLWREYDNVLTDMMQGRSAEVGPCYTDGTSIVLPTGLKLYYDNLRVDGRRRVFDYGRETKDVYGGKLVENIVQSLDRAHVMDAAQRIDKALKEVGINHIRLAHQVHDELIYVVPDGLVSTLGVIAEREMSTPATWGTGLPLAAEVKVGQNYGDMK